MDDLEFKGENAEITSEHSSLDTVLISEKEEMKNVERENSLEDQKINGDSSLSMRGNNSPSKKKLRKSKAASVVSGDSNRLCFVSSLDNRTLPEGVSEMYSSESEEFSGFDSKELHVSEPGKTILKKLLAEAESISELAFKRQKIVLPLLKNVKNADNLIEEADGNSTDSEDQKLVSAGALCTNTDESKSLSEKLASNNMHINANRSRRSRYSRGASPGNTIRQKVSVDITNPAYKEPFNYGWKRELVYRAGASENQSRRMADIYYYTPEGKKVRSYREVIEFLTTCDLTIDNFTFFKEPLGINDPEKEIIRDAKKSKDIYHNKSSIKASKKIAEVIATKKNSPKRMDKSPPLVASYKTSPRSIKSSATFKVKLPVKKSTYKRGIKSPSAVLEKETSISPQWTLPVTRRNQNVSEKSLPTKTTKMISKKQTIQNVDHRHHFMASVCAGYSALSRIFQYLKVQELLRAARVCRMWRDLAAHPSLWKTVRMKNSQVTDWDGFADALKTRGTQHLDLRKMLIVGESDYIWKKFVHIIPRVTSLIKLELCRCPATVVEDVMKNCPQLKILNATSIKCDSLNLESIINLKDCNELRLKAISGMSLQGDLSYLTHLTRIRHLSLTSVKELGKKKIEILQFLQSLDTLELGECSDLPDKFGTSILVKLRQLEKLRLEKGQGSCCTFDILEGISKLENLTQLELVNFDVKNGFNDYLANCKNIKRLLIIPTYVSQSATSNNMILGGVTELSNNLTHFVWGVTQELLRVTELFVDQCNQMSKQITGDSIPVLKPVPCLNLIGDSIMDKTDEKDELLQQNVSNPQVEILPLPHLQKLLLTALPKTRVKILKIPFHATWRQSISESTS